MEKELQKDTPAQEANVDNELEAIKKKNQELEIHLARLKQKELEKEIEFLNKKSEAVANPETQVKTPTKPIVKDPSKAYDDLMSERREFEEVYGHGQLYNQKDPVGQIKCKIVLDQKWIQMSHPDWDEEKIKQEIIDHWKDELSML